MALPSRDLRLFSFVGFDCHLLTSKSLSFQTFEIAGDYGNLNR